MRTPSLIPIAVVLLSLAQPAAAAPAAGFDAGVDASAVLVEAKSAVAAEKVSEKVSAKAFRRYERDCVTFRFGPADALESEAVWLRSTEWVEECYQTGDPRHGGGRQCHERPGQTYRERAQVKLTQRLPLLPWESDTFQVCLEGPWVDARQFESAYEYRRAGGSGRDGVVVAEPVKKTPMRPDPKGVLATLAPDLTVTLADRWASYYAGEKLVVKLTLKRHYPNWFDPTLLEKEIELPVAATSVVDLKIDLAQMSEQPKPGKPYYVEYSIKRVGAVSKPDFTKSLESNKADYAPAAALASR